MADFNVRSDGVNVEQIMEQIRARVRAKRGVDYTEEQIRELAAVKLQKFLDPRGVRSDLLDQYRKTQPPYEPPDLPNYAFESDTLFDSHRAPLRFVRRLLQPLLKLFFNPNPLIQALNIQSRFNRMIAEREARREASRLATESLSYELIHNLVLEMTRLGIEVKNLSMRIESLTGRLEFNERRARALESVVVYKPAADSTERRDRRAPAQPSQRPQEAGGSASASRTSTDASGGWQPAAPSGPQSVPAPSPSSSQPGPSAAPGEGPGQRSRRRRRRRGRRGGGMTGGMAGAMGANTTAATGAGGPPPTSETPAQAAAGEGTPGEGTGGKEGTGGGEGATGSSTNRSDTPDGSQ